MRSALVIFLAVVCPFELRAFSGPEHRDLSNLALRAALASGHGSEAMRTEAEKLLCLRTCEGTFGELVAAVDHFSVPEDHLATPDAWCAVRDRQKQWFFHLLATHRNSAHFQGEALTHYATGHAKAIEISRSDPSLALYREAVALHFLEDSLASGHMITPRRGMPNAVAGSLHDKMSRVGAKAEFADKSPAWTQTITFLRRIDPKPPHSRMILRKDPPNLTFTEDEVDAFEERLASPSPVLFFGDGLLNSPQASTQKVAILMLAARSLMDVLEASVHQPEQTVQTCFTPRNVEVGPGFQNLSAFFGPTGAFRIGDSGSAEWDRDHRWLILPQCTSEPAFVRYDVDRTDGFDGMLYSFPGYAAAAFAGVGSRSGERRLMIEGSKLFTATDPPNTVMRRLNDGTVTNRAWRRRSGNAGAAMTVSVVKASDYFGIGLLGEGRYSFAAIKRGFTFGPRLGVRHYESGKRSTNRFEYGMKVAVGTEVLDLTLVVDRGATVRNDAAIGEWFVMGGMEITVSKGWFKIVWDCIH